MISLTMEQREYKERTLQQLFKNQAMLEANLEEETDPRLVRTIQKQIEAIETHINRLNDELAGNVIFDEPVADGFFQKAARALAKEKFHLARRYIGKLETIEPFYPGLDRLKQEAESQRVSRRTKSIARGTATNYPGVVMLPPPSLALATAGVANAAEAGGEPHFVTDRAEAEKEKTGWFSYLFQFHVMISCLVVLLLTCVMFSVAGATILQWLIEGGV